MDNKNTPGMFENIDYKDLAFMILRRLWIVILAFAIAFAYCYYTKELTRVPCYKTSATMYVTNSNDIKYYYSSSDTYNAQNLIKTCGVVINTAGVRQEIADELNSQGKTYVDGNPYKADYINIEVSSVNETEVMQITATTTNPQVSADICNAALEVVPQVLKDKIKVGAAEVLDVAPVNKSNINQPTYNSPLMYGGVAAGIVVAVFVMLYMVDTRIKSKEEITQVYGLPVLSEIPNFNVKSKERYNAYYEHR